VELLLVGKAQRWLVSEGGQRGEIGNSRRYFVLKLRRRKGRSSPIASCTPVHCESLAIPEQARALGCFLMVDSYDHRFQKSLKRGISLADDIFYEQGLNFECARCGKCCRQSGDVFLSALDLRRLAESLGLSDAAFFKTYCEVVDLRFVKRVSLVAKPGGGCVFLGEKGCEVYEYRPLQCQSFPFWPTNLGDSEEWEQAAETCRGIGQGKLWSAEEIDECVERRQGDPLLDVGS
jgi:hypothetical protein